MNYFDHPKFEESSNNLSRFVPEDKQEEFNEALIRHNYLIANAIDSNTYPSKEDR